MKKAFYHLLALSLCFALAFCAGCQEKYLASNTDASSKADTSLNADTSSDTDATTDKPRGEALTEEEKPFEDYIYKYGFYSFNDNDFPTLTFDKAMSLYGEKSINVIGDSISHGMQSGKMYNNSWTNLFKNSFNKQFGTNNFGYVSLLDSSGYGDTELHKIRGTHGTWYMTRHDVHTPGFCTYSSTDKAGYSLKIELDRKADGYDRHINGFYIYYIAGPNYGGFEVAVNGTTVHTELSHSELDYTARTKYIAIPDGLESFINITITKTDNKLVSICGIAYAESDSGVMINNYSHSGMTLCEINDDLLRKMCESNYVILALGYNDAGHSKDIADFREKLFVVSTACRETGATLICLDFMWPKGTNTGWVRDYKNEVFNCAQDAEGYYIDFTDLYKVDSDYLLADAAHPTPKGCKLIARKICYFFGIPYTSELG